jgi:hypothetical protein
MRGKMGQLVETDQRDLRALPVMDGSPKEPLIYQPLLLGS